MGHYCSLKGKALLSLLILRQIFRGNISPYRIILDTLIHFLPPVTISCCSSWASHARASAQVVTSWVSSLPPSIEANCKALRIGSLSFSHHQAVQVFPVSLHCPVVQATYQDGDRVPRIN